MEQTDLDQTVTRYLWQLFQMRTKNHQGRLNNLLWTEERCNIQTCSENNTENIQTDIDFYKVLLYTQAKKQFDSGFNEIQAR